MSLQSTDGQMFGRVGSYAREIWHEWQTSSNSWIRWSCISATCPCSQWSWWACSVKKAAWHACTPSLFVAAQAAAVRDTQGMLPLHLAVQQNAPAAVVEAVLGAHPEVVPVCVPGCDPTACWWYQA